MGHDKIPALPSFIMAPTTLIAQWRADLEKWLSDDACHTITYRGNEDARKVFFEPQSPYDTAMKSKHPERTIMFVEAPVRRLALFNH
jgi:SNF2 family DNA or RNA helicase